MSNVIIVKGLKRAVGEYKIYNKGGRYSPEYGVLMFDESDGKIWCDYFFDLGHNSWNEYHSDTIINIGAEMLDCCSTSFDDYKVCVNMATIKDYITKKYKGKYVFATKNLSKGN